MLYAIDIDNTITDPKFYDPDFEVCATQYITDGIICQEDVKDLQRHPQMYLLPQIARSHIPKPGAVKALQGVKAVEYFTVRNHVQPAICEAIHQTTYTWLEEHGFPNPKGVTFFWDVAMKLLAAIESEEEQIILIDDRPEGLFKAYRQIAAINPEQAQQIRERVTLVAFGYSNTQQFSIPEGLTVLALANWLHEPLSHLGKCS